MSIDDLAIDVGFVVDTEDYDVFVACVQNILEYGCKYNQETMDNIIEKCKTSKLDIATQVIRECRRPSERYRKPKWWQTYQSKQQRTAQSTERRSPERRSPERRPPERRPPERRIPMNLEFKPVPKKMKLEFKKRPVPQYDSVPMWPGREASPPRRRQNSPPRRYVRAPPKSRRRGPDNRHGSNRHRRRIDHRQHNHPYIDRRPSSPQRQRKRRRY